MSGMPIHLDKLRAVRRVIVHANCPDGRASALILHAALPNARIDEMAYGDPAHEALQPEPGLLFCDFTPPKDRLAEFAATGAIVLDHHDVDLTVFGDHAVKGDNAKAESGAALALREVYAPLFFERLQPSPADASEARACENVAELAAIRDTWQRASPVWEAAGTFSEALRFVPLDDALAMGPARLLRLAEDLGPTLRRKKLEAARQAAQNAVRWTIAGRRVAVLSSVTLTSDVADVLGAEVDLVVGFEYVQEPGRVRLQLSLRSRGDVNVTAIAKANGGGGHENGRAAGCHFPVSLAEHPTFQPRSPYASVRSFLEASL